MFAHATTAVLSWHAQTFVLITWLNHLIRIWMKVKCDIWGICIMMDGKLFSGMADPPDMTCNDVLQISYENNVAKL